MPSRPRGFRAAILALIALSLAPAARAAEAPGPGRAPIPAAQRSKAPAIAPGTDGTGRWYAVQLHAHSAYSDGVHSLAGLLRWARAGGLDALAVTEHNTERHLADPAFTQAQDVLLIPAFEWTSSFQAHREDGVHGHASVWGLRPGQVAALPETLAARALLHEARAAGLTVGVNHPFEPRYPWPEDDYGEADALEVWHWIYGLDEAAGTPLPEGVHRPHHHWGDFVVRNARALEAWQRALRRGHHLTPLAVADFHVLGQALESPCTMIWSPTRSVDGLLAGLRAGHVALVERPNGPRVELWADGDGDGRFEALAGDTVRRGATVQVRVHGGAGLTLSVYGHEGRLARETVPSDDWRREWPAEQAGFYWARLDQTAWYDPFRLNPLKAMSGALFVRD